MKLLIIIKRPILVTSSLLYIQSNGLLYSGNGSVYSENQKYHFVIPSVYQIFLIEFFGDKIYRNSKGSKLTYISKLII